METKAVTEDFNMRSVSNWTPFDIQYTMEKIEKIFEECDEILSGAKMSTTGYVKQTEKIEKAVEGMGILNSYAFSAHSQAYNELDRPLFLGFSKGATETLSRINLNEITTENTFKMEEHYLVDGSQYSYMYEYGKRIKSELTMEDFMGLAEIKAHEGMPTLENMETVGIFAELFRMEYQNMNPSETDINEQLKGILISGEFDHKAYHPVKDFLSAVADVTIILPLIESITGKDYITGEDLTDLECGLKAGGAIVDLLTFGNGAILMDAAGKGVKEFALVVAKTMAVDALASGTSYLAGEMLEDMGLPQGASTVLTALVSGTVTYSAGKYFFKDATGKVIGEYTEEELEKLLKGELNNIPPEIPKVKGSVANEFIEGGRSVRNIVDTNGLRNDLPLTQEQIDELVSYAKELGFPEDKICIADAISSNNTGLLFNDILIINNDALPTNLSTSNPNSLISGRGAIAHEIIGHYETALKGTALNTTDIIEGQAVRNWYNTALDEAQASIRAARFAPDLTLSDRTLLIRDGLQRLKEQGLKLKDVRHLLDIIER